MTRVLEAFFLLFHFLNLYQYHFYFLFTLIPFSVLFMLCGLDDRFAFQIWSIDGSQTHIAFTHQLVHPLTNLQDNHLSLPRTSTYKHRPSLRREKQRLLSHKSHQHNRAPTGALTGLGDLQRREGGNGGSVWERGGVHVWRSKWNKESAHRMPRTKWNGDEWVLNIVGLFKLFLPSSCSHIFYCCSLHT